MQTPLHNVAYFNFNACFSAYFEDFLSSRAPPPAAGPSPKRGSVLLFFATFFDTPFWAPISPKGCPKVSIVGIWEPKKPHFGSHFGVLFGSSCKSEN